MTVSGGSNAGIVGANWVDARHSLYPYIDSQDPNVSYQTASGYTYFPPSDTIPVTIAIRPGGNPTDPNPINLRAAGVLPVFLLTTPTFDARAITESSPTIGDPNVTGRVSPVKMSYQDVDGDGDIDLIMHFSIPQLVAAGAINQATKDLKLTGQLQSGTVFMGSDHVIVK